jgi:hypothetical protein
MKILCFIILRLVFSEIVCILQRFICIIFGIFIQEIGESVTKKIIVICSLSSTFNKQPGRLNNFNSFFGPDGSHTQQDANLCMHWYHVIILLYHIGSKFTGT